MEDSSTELFYMFFDIILFIMSLAVVFMIYRSTLKTTYNAAYLENSINTTSSEMTLNNALDQSLKNSYEGYTESYSRSTTGSAVTLEMYDGDVSGAALLTDILEADEDINIYILDGSSIKDLNSMVATGTGVNFLKYARTTSVNQLQALIDTNATYQRRIEKTADGEISAIRYSKY